MLTDPSFLYFSTVLPPILLGIIIWKSDRFQEPGKFLVASFLLGVSIILPLDLLIMITEGHLAPFFGLDMEFNPELSFILEYNAALNENDMTAETLAINSGGYLNAAIRWTFVEHLHIEMDLNNLLFNDDKVDYFNRELKITYIEYF